MKRTLSILLGVSASLLMPVAALAASVVTATENTTITLPSDSSQYTIKAGSTFNNLTVSGTAFTLTLDPKDQTTIIATNKRTLTNNAGIQTNCSSSQSDGVFSVATTGVRTSVTITPGDTCTVSTATASGGGSGGGGGGGGGGSSSSAAPATPATPATPAAPATPATSVTPAAVPATPATPVTPATPAAPVILITRSLTRGSLGNDVKSLQQFLASDTSLYPEGIVNGSFGPKTLAAVKRFQEKYGIAQKGQAGYGLVGPKTRAKIKELSGSRAASSPAPSPSTSSNMSALQDQLKILQDMMKKLQQK